MRDFLVLFILTVPLTLFGQTEDAFSLGEDESSQTNLDDVLEDIESEEFGEPKNDPENNIVDSPSKLEKLVQFQDVAVIQKRYLPKKGRFEITPFSGLIVDNAFYLISPIGAMLGYFFTENLGIELSAAHIMQHERSITTTLASDNFKVEVKNLPLPKRFYDASIKLSQAYGKLGFFRNKIVPFDMYLAAGAGVTETNQTGINKNPIHLKFNAGQTYAITKSLAFKWDMAFRFYNLKKAQEEESNFTNSSPNNGQKISMTGWASDMYFTVGLSFFFPEAGYR